MGETTHISWADSTLNVWMGCTKVSNGPQGACENCYAQVLVEERFGRAAWGPHAERIETKSWRAQLRKISRMATEAGRPWFVFVNSLSDFWDNQADWRLRLEALEAFRAHPHLTFLLLTKRPQMIVRLTTDLVPFVDELGRDPAAYLTEYWPRNVAIGCTAVTQEEADRDIPWLLEAAARLQPAFAFISAEPLMGDMDIRWAISRNRLDIAAGFQARGKFSPGLETVRRVGWVITGGETDQGKHRARPSDPAWFRSIRDQCADAGVAFHFKQWGEHIGADQFENRAEMVDMTTNTSRVGKKASGRLLDGQVHDARP